MLPLNLCDTDIMTIKKEKNLHTCASVRRRLLVLWMVHKGFRYCDVALAVDCHRNTVTKIIKMYEDGGLGRILQVPTSTTRHALSSQFEQVSEQLNEATIHTLQQAREWFADKFAYHASKESVCKLLHRLGFRHLKVNPFLWFD